MKIFISSLLLALIFSSCGLEFKNARKDRSPASIGELLSASAALSNSAYQAAVDICFAFKSKRLNNSLKDLEFLFEVKTESCNFSKSSESVSMFYRQVNSSGPSYRYETSRNIFYIDTVETDLNGELSSICSKIFSNTRPSDTEDVGGGNFRQFDFKNIADPDIKIVNIKTASAQTNTQGQTEYFVTKNEELQIKVFDTDSKKIGIVESRFRTEKCMGTSHVSILNQKNLGRVL